MSVKRGINLQNTNYSIDQSDMLQNYSDEERNGGNSSTPPMNTKIIDELLVTFRSAIKVTKSSLIILVFMDGVLLFLLFLFS